MQVAEAYSRIAQASRLDSGRFYSPGSSIGLGKGKIYHSVTFPIFDPSNGIYLTAEGLAIVLTHECDVDQNNDRCFNEDVLICPIIELGSLIEAYLNNISEPQLVSFLSNLGAMNISRLFFIPPLSNCLPYGGIIYLNQITNTHINTFQTATPVAAVTGYGLETFERVLENHLLRPKAERLAFVPDDLHER